MNDILFKVPMKSNERLSQLDFYQSKLNFEVDPADLAESLRTGEQIVIVDTRSAEAFKAEHIPGAINIPHRTMTRETTQQLNRKMLYVTYCDSIGCNASTKGALNLARLGFKVKELIGGLECWKTDGYATEGSKATRGTAITCNC